jgi:hypothetical protein
MKGDTFRTEEKDMPRFKSPLISKSKEGGETPRKIGMSLPK